MSRKVDELLNKAFEDRASDIHLTTGLAPVFRVNGQLRTCESNPLSHEEIVEYMTAIMSDELIANYEDAGEVDFSYEIPDISRFRINVYKQREGTSVAIRLIPNKIPSIEQLKLPDVLKKIALKPQGLVLVTGPTGSGKSTTLAAMIDYINENSRKHIITLEDPIEYIHRHKQSVVEQREVGRDTKMFSSGLRAALRQDPDVILVGEMRDLETISTAVTAAETGHLVLGTLHTNNAPSTMERIVDVFPGEQQAQIRFQLASVLQAVISQRLFPTKTGEGRIAATEVLIQNSAVSSLIRNQKIHQLANVMQTSRDTGMQTLEMSIKTLLQKQLVTREAVQGYLGENIYGAI